MKVLVPIRFCSQARGFFAIASCFNVCILSAAAVPRIGTKT